MFQVLGKWCVIVTVSVLNKVAVMNLTLLSPCLFFPHLFLYQIITTDLDHLGLSK